MTVAVLGAATVGVVAALLLGTPLSATDDLDESSSNEFINADSASVNVGIEDEVPGTQPESGAVSDNGITNGSDEPLEPDTGIVPGACGGLPDGCTADETIQPDATEPYTITEVATFAPPPSVLANEPAGFGVVGLPTNFVVTAQTHIASGELRDREVTVTFEPVSFTFSPGDGTTFTTKTGGDAWTTIDTAQFTPTQTSHVYDERGTYTATVTIDYSATVTIDDTTIAVPGTLSITSAGLDIEVLEVRTALVENTCTEDPGGPGC